MKIVLKGGKGSGNFGHAGRPGKIGGSAPAMGRGVSGGKLPPGKRVWQGQKYDQPRQLTNIQTGNIGEEMAAKAMEDHLGVEFSGLNIGRTNAPVDIAGDHHAIEVKAGPASNGRSAQHWRATIATETPNERKLVRQMSKEEKRAYNQYKQQQVFERKNAMVAEMSKMAGTEIKPATVGVILTPDGKRGDVFLFDGFHARIGWNKTDTGTYLGTYEIDDPNNYKEEIFKGGKGSGNWGHAGRPGKRGGSAPKSGIGASMSLRTGKSASKRQAAAKGDNAQPSVEELLKREIKVDEGYVDAEFSGITNGKFIGELEDGTKVLVKPSDYGGLRPTAAESETQTYETAKLLGYDNLVTPSTVMADGRNAQVLQKGETLKSYNASRGLLDQYRYGSDPVMDSDMRKIMVLDAVVGNGDRHGNNIFVVERNGQKRLMAIDNDAAYTNTRGAAAGYYMRGTVAKSMVAPDAERLVADLKPSELSGIVNLYDKNTGHWDTIGQKFGTDERSNARSRASYILNLWGDVRDAN